MSHKQQITTALAVLFLAAPLAAQDMTGNGMSQELPAVVVAGPVAAPSVTPIVTELPASVIAASLAPTLSNAAVGIRANAAVPAKSPAPFQDRVGRNPAMMIVGAVALIAGSFIDGDAGTIIMIAGGGLGLYGLWQYLK